MPLRKLISFALAAAVTGIVSSVRPALAQGDDAFVPFSYDDTIDAGAESLNWDASQQDRIFGTVDAFWPYHLRLRQPDGTVQMVDLHDGTIIKPLDWTPMNGERVMLNGNFVHGIFAADRLVVMY